jgi:hypothetical protein
LPTSKVVRSPQSPISSGRVPLRFELDNPLLGGREWRAAEERRRRQKAVEKEEKEEGAGNEGWRVGNETRTEREEK